jgi:pyruvate,water dikinase
MIRAVLAGRRRAGRLAERSSFHMGSAYVNRARRDRSAVRLPIWLWRPDRTGRCRPTSVAVRSSAIDEDGALTSFAGVHETFLNVRGDDALLTAIRRCLESFFSPRALTYRQERGAERGAFDDVRMAVLVQQQITSDVSIVAFSANPVTAARDEIVVTAPGAGELVGGTVTPDTMVGATVNQAERVGDGAA